MDWVGRAGNYRTARRDRKMVLIFDRRTPVDVRPFLETHGVSDLFVVEVDEDKDEDAWGLVVELQEALEGGGFRGPRLLPHDGTGPLVFLTHEPDGVRARQADAICARFPAAHEYGAE